MKLAVVFLTVLSCFAGGAPPAPQLAPISIFVQDQSPPPEIFAPLRDEVAAILAPVGLQFRWFEVKDAKTAGAVAELAVVTFRGHCDLSGLIGRIPLSARALGYTSMTDGEILPFTTVDCERTQSFLGTALLRMPAKTRPVAFGRALGRILAHELYHVFANTTVHGHGGVAKEAYTVADLLAPEFTLDEVECELLRTSPAYNSLMQPTR